MFKITFELKQTFFVDQQGGVQHKINDCDLALENWRVPSHPRLSLASIFALQNIYLLTVNQIFIQQQARKLQDAQAEKLTSLQASKLTS